MSDKLPSNAALVFLDLLLLLFIRYRVADYVDAKEQTRRGGVWFEDEGRVNCCLISRIGSVSSSQGRIKVVGTLPRYGEL